MSGTQARTHRRLSVYINQYEVALAGSTNVELVSQGVRIATQCLVDNHVAVITARYMTVRE